MRSNPVLKSRFASLKTSGLLPSPKGAALAVLRLTQKDSSTAAELAHAVEADPALVARLIKLANSCQFAGTRPILAIRDAISILGQNAVRGLTLAVSLMGQRQVHSCPGFDYDAFWSRALARAVAMRHVSGRVRVVQADEAFTLGLLSHVGELGLAGLFPKTYGAVRLSGGADTVRQLALERESYAFDHAELTAEMLLDWGFPEALVEPALLFESHDAPASGMPSRLSLLVWLLRLGSLVATICLAPADSRQTWVQDLLTLGAEQGIEPAELLTLCDAAVADWADWSRLLQVDATTLPPFAELAKLAPVASIQTPTMDSAAAPGSGEPSAHAAFAAEFARLNQRIEEARQRDLANEQRMELALQGAELGSWDWHVPSGAVVLNERWCNILGYRSREIVPHMDSWRQLVHPDDRDRVIHDMQQHFKGQTPGYENEHRLRHKNGSWIWVLDRAKVVERAPDGAPLRVVGTHMDITQRKHIETELLRSNAELEQFSYTISHDLRQPLRMISSYLQLLEKDLAPHLGVQQRAYFDFALDGARHMDAMMLGLLDYSRIGRQGEPTRWVESRGMVEQALQFLQPGIRETGAQVQCLGDWPMVLVSPLQTLRLVQNLLSNALKFRDAQRTPDIRLTSHAEPGVWRFCVADNGIGFAPSQSGRLFQVFSRLQPRTAFEGTGIGLALCRKIAEHQGGRIWAESAGEGKGSLFGFELPQHLPDAEVDATRS